MKRNDGLKSTIRLLALGGLVVLISLLPKNGEAEIKDQQHQALIDQWLLKTCDEGELGILERRLEDLHKILGQDLEDEFVEAFNNGPSQRILKNWREQLKLAFDEFEGELIDFKKELNDQIPIDIAALEELTFEEYLEEETEHFKISYRSQALPALGIVGGEKAEEILKQQETDERSIWRFSAKYIREKVLRGKY